MNLDIKSDVSAFILHFETPPQRLANLNWWSYQSPREITQLLTSKRKFRREFRKKCKLITSPNFEGKSTKCRGKVFRCIWLYERVMDFGKKLNYTRIYHILLLTGASVALQRTNAIKLYLLLLPIAGCLLSLALNIFFLPFQIIHEK